MTNKIITTVFVLVVLIMLLTLLVIAKDASAKQPDVLECCVENEPTEPVVEETKSSSRRSGSYIKKVVKPVMVYDVVKYGSMGQAVKDFQMFLNNKINAGLVVDGIFGDLTLKSWLEFEKTIK